MPSASLSIRSPAMAVEAARRAAKAEPRRLQPVARTWKGLIAASPANPHYAESSSYAAPGREATGRALAEELATRCRPDRRRRDPKAWHAAAGASWPRS